MNLKILGDDTESYKHSRMKAIEETIVSHAVIVPMESPGSIASDVQ